MKKIIFCSVSPFILLLLTFHMAIAAPASFVAPRIQSTNAPSAPTLADFNGDGRQDLVFIDYLRNFVSISLGNGDGSFQAVNVIYAGTGTEGSISSGATAVAGDFNGDGKMDLAVANNTQGIISILLGNGNGTFRTKVDYLPGINLTGITTGDFNGDGKLDLAAASDSGTLTAVLLGNGNGTFQAATYYGTGTTYRSTISAGDLNGDGNLDLVLRNSYSTFSVLFGIGNGTFYQTDYSIGGGGVRVADLNGDGMLDLATTGTNAIRILLGNGDGTFQPYVEYATGAGPSDFKARDVNSDGFPDLIVGTRDDQSVSILLGNGDGSFQAKQDYFLGTEIGWLAVADLNGDDRLDLVTVNGTILHGATFSVISLLGNGDGTFQTKVDYAAGGNVDSVRTADFNGDGKMDLVVANSNNLDGTVAILLGTGDGTFQSKVDYSTGINSNFVAVSDLNGDGKLDLAVVNGGDSNTNSTISILLGNGNGTFQAKVDYTVGLWPQSATIGDFNGDGKLDLAVANHGVPGSISILLGNGNGTFQAKVDNYDIGIWPSTVVAGDFNGDGKMDLAVADNTQTEWGTAVSILLGNGNGSFQSRRINSIGMHYSASGGDNLVTSDFNGDGKLDLATVSGGPISVMLGNGDGTFQAEVNYVTDVWGGASVTVGDFNGDGKLDLATSTPSSRTVSVLLGNGNGTFQASMNFLTGGNYYINPSSNLYIYGPVSITAGDFNGDGRLDLVTANYGMASILLNNTPPDWTSGYPAAGTIGAETLQLLLKSNENGTAYFVALPSGSPAPTAGQVKGGTNAAGVAVAANLKGSVSLAANIETSVVMSLSSPVPGTVYDIYAVAENNFPKLQATPVKTSMATPAQAPAATTGVATFFANDTYKLNGIVSSNGASTTVTFEYGETTSYGYTTALFLASGANNASVSRSVGLACNKIYHFRVKAENSLGAVTGSDAEFVTNPCPADPPTNIEVQSPTVAGQLVITWNKPTSLDFSHSHIYRSTVAGTLGNLIADEITGIKYTDTGLASQTQYYYTVRSVGNANNESTNTTQVSGTSLDVTPPAVPTNITAIFTGPMPAIIIAWTQPADTDFNHFHIYRSTSPGTLGPLVYDNIITTNKTDANLENGTTYYYTIRAVDTRGNETNNTAQVSATVSLADVTGPGAVSNVIITFPANGDKTTLTWTNPGGDFALTRIYRSTTSGQKDTLVYQGTATTYTDSNITPGTSYWYTIDALDGAGNISAYVAPSVTPLDTQIPGCISQLKATPLADAKIKLSWLRSPSTDVNLFYDIYTDNGSGTISATSSASTTHPATEWTSGTLSNGTTYQYALKVADGSGNTTTICATVAATALTIPAASGVSASIKAPLSGKKYTGNQLLVMAEQVAGGAPDLKEIEFQYYNPDTTTWEKITPAAATLNPDSTPSYFIYWDVSGMTNGDYKLRAVASNTNSVADSAPGFTTLTLNKDTPDIIQNGGNSQETVNTTSGGTIATADASITIPAGTFTADATVTVTTPDPATKAATVPTNYDNALSFHDITTTGTITADSTIAVEIPYTDANDDLKLDTAPLISVLDLKICRNISGQTWSCLDSTVDTTSKVVRANTTALGLMALLVPPVTLGQSGWNMTSVALTPLTPTPFAVFGTSGNYVQTYNPTTQAYQAASTIVPGNGYLVWGAKNLKPKGTEISAPSFSIPIKKGWNIIGNPYKMKILAKDLHVNCGTQKTITDSEADGEIVGTFFHSVNGAYQLAVASSSTDTIDPWKGYWVLSDKDCNLIVTKP